MDYFTFLNDWNHKSSIFFLNHIDSDFITFKQLVRDPSIQACLFENPSPQM